MIHSYLAAPVTPVDAETIEGNLRIAKRWYRVLSDRFRHRIFVADWILHVEAFAGDIDADPALRELGMTRNFEQIERCHEIFLVGCRTSTGMERELVHAKKCGLSVFDLIGAVDVAPELPEWLPRTRWMRP